MEDEPEDDIAVVGMACRVPGARSPEALWRLLLQGVDAITRPTSGELAAAGAGPERDHPDYVRAKGVLEDADCFDAGFFGISPREAGLLDPQHRQLIECAWEALERAGYIPDAVPGWVGTYVGCGHPSYLLHNLAPGIAAGRLHPFHVLQANDKDFLATRVAWLLDLKGPALTVQTACSTSLVAVHLACNGLLSHQCDMALAGGVSVTIPLLDGYRYMEGGITSPDGRCRPFDAAARGTVLGNGAGVVVLKRLADALADEDPILAVIKGSAVTNDGALRAGYTAPGLEGQVRTVEMAHAVADIDPRTITCVEAHGTGTPMGDPIEVAALTKVFRDATDDVGFCALGSIKANLGHLDTAAGVAGLIKTVLSLQHRVLLPTPHYQSPNPGLFLDTSPFVVHREATPWQPDVGTRRAAVSSFGMGGTNAHIVLEEAPDRPPSALATGWVALPLSARTAASLERATARLSSFLDDHPETAASDVAFTLQTARKAFDERTVQVRLGSRGPDAEVRVSGRVWPAAPEVVFLIPGQGAQHRGMGAGLYDAYPAYREAVDTCSAHLHGLLGLDLRDLLFSSDPQDDRLDDTGLAQPALFVVAWAQAQLWAAVGVRPAAMFGHSLGELVAACLAGVWSLPDALRIVVQRGRLMAALPPGAMAAVALPPDAIGLGDALSVAAHNGPRSTVVSGPTDAIAALQTRLVAQGTAVRRLHTSHAFHSAMMDPVLAPFEALLRRVPAKRPSVRWVSGLTGTWITEALAVDPAYWSRQLRSPVQLARGLATLAAGAPGIQVEVGPGTTMNALVRQQPTTPSPRLAVASSRHPRSPEPDARRWLAAVGQLWCAGVPVDWRGLHTRAHRRVALPPYAFERRRCWVDPPAAPAPAAPTLDSWLSSPTWVARPLPEPSQPSGTWLVCTSGSSVGAAVVERLRAAGVQVVVATAGERAGPAGSDYELRADEPADHVELLAWLAGRGALPERIVHLWTLDLPPDASLSACQRLGYHSLVALGTALARTGCTTSVTVGVERLYDLDAPGPLRPELATMLGPCLVLPQEHPALRCGLVDVESTDPDAASRLLLEAAGDLDEPVVLHRPEGRFVRRLARCPVPEAAPLPDRPVVLITGGLGEIGLQVAEHLAANARARLLLLGRRDLAADDPRRERLRAMQRGGAEVLVLVADVADRAALRAAVAEGRARFGPIARVFHAAGFSGLAALSPIADTDRAVTAAHFRAKVDGLQALAEVLGDEPRRWCLLSSLATWTGGIGCTAYAAANAYMDAFAVQQHRQGRAEWVSVDLDVWLGEARQLPVHSRAALAPGGVSPVEGLSIFLALLRGESPPQVVVSGRPLESIAERVAPPRRAPASRALPGERTAPGDELERVLVDIWQEALGGDAPGIDDDFFALGGHSLVAVEMMATVQEAVGVRVPVHAVLEHPTIAGLAGWIRSAGAGAAAPAADLPWLVKLQPGRPGQAPVFLVHAVGGTVFVYRDLARRLGTDRPVFGLRSMALEDESDAHADVEVMAARYVDAVRAVWPTGPYHLGGLSLGGVIAFEMAQQLRAAGHAVGLLAMMDSPGGGELPAPLDDAATTADYLTQLVPGLFQEGGSAEGSVEAPMERLAEMFQAGVGALSRYRIAPYPGRILFFRAQQRDRINPLHPERAWIDQARDGVEVHVVPGNHLSMVLEPHVGRLAALMERALTERRRGP